MTSRLCSITITVFPLSTNLLSTAISTRISSKCKPVVGSSNIYKVFPVSRLESSVANFTRWLSPPTRWGRLSQLDIPQPYFLQDFYFIQNLRYVLKELHSPVNSHIQHIGYGFSLKTHFQRFTVITFAMTYFTWDQDIRQEIHFNCLVTVTATSFATSSGHIE